MCSFVCFSYYIRPQIKSDQHMDGFKNILRIDCLSIKEHISHADRYDPVLSVKGWLAAQSFANCLLGLNQTFRHGCHCVSCSKDMDSHLSNLTASSASVCKCPAVCTMYLVTDHMLSAFACCIDLLFTVVLNCMMNITNSFSLSMFCNM